MEGTNKPSYDNSILTITKGRPRGQAASDTPISAFQGSCPSTAFIIICVSFPLEC